MCIIKNGVGAGGPNHSEDVRIVQELLGWNANFLGLFGSPPPQTGHLDAATLRALQEWQTHLSTSADRWGAAGFLSRPAVLPGSDSLLQLCQGALGGPFGFLGAKDRNLAQQAASITGQVSCYGFRLAVQSRGPRPKPSRFPDDIVRLAQESFKKWGVPVSITLAQWAIESGWGKATPTGSNNTFGIKAEKGYPSVVVRTTENVNGKLVERRLAFRVFNSIPEAFEEHGRLLATGAPYAEARKYTNDPDKFAEALTDKYATVRHYGKILRDFMKANNVYRYDGSAK